MKLSHVQMEASQAANRSLRDDGKERLENVFFFSFFVPKMLAFNCEIRVSFVLTRECVAGERLSYCSGDFGQESSNSGSPSTQQGFFFSVFFCLSSPSFAREDAVTIQTSTYKMRIGACSQVRESQKNHFEILMVENLGSVAFKTISIAGIKSKR